MDGGGVGVAESLRFSPGDKQQETTHLHFQRPALSASPPPGRPRSKALTLRHLSPGVGCGGDPEGEAPLGFPRPRPPPPHPNTHLQPAELGWRLCPWRPSEGTQALRGPLNQSGDKRGDPPLRLGYQRTTGGRQGWVSRSRVGSGGSLGQPRSPGRLWLLFRGRTSKAGHCAARARPRARLGLGSPGLQRRSGSSTRLQRLALPGPGSSRDRDCDRRCGSRTPRPGRRGRREGGESECGNCGCTTPPRPKTPPETRHQDPGCRALQAPRTRDCLPGSQRQPGESRMAEGRKEGGGEPAAISHRSSERPAGRLQPLAPTGPSPGLGSKI